MGSEAPLDVLGAFATPKLRRRRFELIPLRGAGAAFTETQGRRPGEQSSPVALSDLISSISEIGVLQPILVEELPGRRSRKPAMRVVTGERRLQAARWGAINLPDNPHFAEMPAIVCPGPLSAEERRTWQIIENLAREPLRPGEQAAALLLHRCAVLTGKLLKAGRPVPSEVYGTDDPVHRFRALERIRDGDTGCAAPWGEVLARLGLQLTPRKARELVRAFAALPRELSEEMDADRVALHTRIRFAALHRGRAEAAEEIWAAVKSRSRTDLLASAVTTSLAHPELPADQAVERAEELQDAANQARAAKLSHDHTAAILTGEASGDVADEHVVTAALEGMRGLAEQLAAGRSIAAFDAGSLKLMLDRCRALLEEAVPA